MITIGNSNIIIDNISNRDKGNLAKFLKSKLSVWTKSPRGGKYIGWEAYEYSSESDSLKIHKGIKLSELSKYFRNDQFVYDDVPNPFKKIQISCMINPRDQEQKNSIDFLMNNKDSQLFLCLKPGSGKTYCAINYISKRKLTPIIIADSQKIIDQWKKSFLKFTDIEESEICLIVGSDKINKLLNNKDSSNKYKVYIASHRTLQTFCKLDENSDDFDWSLIDLLFSKLGIGIKIFDEAHVEWRNIFYIDNNSNIKYNIYLTATPDRSNPSEKIVYDSLFGGIRKYGLEGELRDEHYIKYMCLNWNSNPDISQKIEMHKNGYGFDNNYYNNYILDNCFETFFDVLYYIVNCFDSQMKNKFKVAVVVNCNNMIERLYKEFSNVYAKKDIGIFCGLTPLKERNKELDKPLILTTVKGFNKGVDVANLTAVINCTNVSSSVVMEQLTGRLRYNEKCSSSFIQLTDKGFDSFIKNERIRCKCMKDIASELIDTEV